MVCPKCQSPNVRRLRGYWEDLPAESPNRRRYAPPDAPNGQPLVALVAVVVGIALAVSGDVLPGLVVAAAGLLWGAAMRRRSTRYQGSLTAYDASRICLAEYYVFA
ncbi:hypothetical protein [Streptomyces sp. NPDC002952]|uniref:hypothetical protein n=1 Tax=Streptomyces sp. NPDC002952 TaxID=3364673 RepID=UPI00367C0069